MIYKNCIDTDIFPDIWNKCNIVPVHKKEDKQLTKLQTSFFLPVFGKKFEKILFKSIFEYLQENNLCCENQSGFWPYDSYEYQLFPIVHKIDVSFYYNQLDVTAVFRYFKSPW